MRPALQEFPWVNDLPADAQEEFAVELSATPEDQRPALLASWQATAEIYADPELHAALAAPSEGDFRPVPPPVV